MKSADYFGSNSAHSQNDKQTDLIDRITSGLAEATVCIYNLRTSSKISLPVSQEPCCF